MNHQPSPVITTPPGLTSTLWMSGLVSIRNIALGLMIGLVAQPIPAQANIGAPIMDVAIANVHQEFPAIARQSSDYREDTGAEVALPVEYETLAIPNKSTPAYTKVETNPWWQLDLRARRNMRTVAARACEGLADNGADGPLLDPSTTEPAPQIACNTDYDLTGAWVLVSDLPFPRDPWAASRPDDPTALISRFPIVSNGYQQSQVADVNRTGRYVRIQFPPGTVHALAIEKVNIRGDEGLTNPAFEFSTAFDALFVETRELLDNLSTYRGNADFTNDEFERLQDRGEQIENAADKAASIAKRIERLDANLGTAINLLGKAEIVPKIKVAARAMKKTLETVRSAVRPLKGPARQAKDKLEPAHDSFAVLNDAIQDFRSKLRASAFWSAVEETAVGGLYQCQVADPDEPNRLIDQPLTGPLEGYSGTRNAQFGLSQVNARMRDLGTVAKAANDEIQNFEEAITRLTAFETPLADIETQLNNLLSPLREIDKALKKKVCVNLLTKRVCLSVNAVLQFIEGGKRIIGLSKLEGLANRILDPIVKAITGPIGAAFPDAPNFPELDLELTDYSALLDKITFWDGIITALRDLLRMPTIFQCAETDGVIEDARVTDEEWKQKHDLGGSGD